MKIEQSCCLKWNNNQLVTKDKKSFKASQEDLESLQPYTQYQKVQLTIMSYDSWQALSKVLKCSLSLILCVTRINVNSRSDQLADTDPQCKQAKSINQ